MRRIALSSVGLSDSYLIRRVRKIAKSDSELRQACPSVHPSVRPSVCLSVCLSVYLSVCLSVCPSVCLSVPPHKSSAPTGRMFMKIDIWIFFRKSVEKNASVFNPLNAKLNPICHLLALLAHHIFHVSGLRVKIWQRERSFTWRLIEIFFYHIALKLFLEWELFQTKLVQEIKTHFRFNNVFRKSRRLWDNVEKQSRTGRRWQYGACALHAR